MTENRALSLPAERVEIGLLQAEIAILRKRIQELETVAPEGSIKRLRQVFNSHETFERANRDLERLEAHGWRSSSEQYLAYVENGKVSEIRFVTLEYAPRNIRRFNASDLKASGDLRAQAAGESVRLNVETVASVIEGEFK